MVELTSEAHTHTEEADAKACHGHEKEGPPKVCTNIIRGLVWKPSGQVKVHLEESHVLNGHHNCMEYDLAFVFWE